MEGPLPSDAISRLPVFSIATRTSFMGRPIRLMPLAIRRPEGGVGALTEACGALKLALMDIVAGCGP